MNDKNSYGEFIVAKRKEMGMTMRSFCKMVNLSPSYFSNMETGKRAAPSFETQCLIADALSLNYEEKCMMFDLAAKTKRDGTLPCDVARYLENDKDLQMFIRKASEKNLKGSDLLKLI